MRKTLVFILGAVFFVAPFLLLIIFNKHIPFDQALLINKITQSKDILVTIVLVIFVIFVYLGLLLLSREFLCWYFKINKKISILQEIRDLLKK